MPVFTPTTPCCTPLPPRFLPALLFPPLSRARLVEQFAGALHPNPEIHETYIDVEPFTGAPFRIAERLQLNIVVGDWDLPSAPLWAYFHWDPEAERAAVAKVERGSGEGGGGGREPHCCCPRCLRFQGWETTTGWPLCAAACRKG